MTSIASNGSAIHDRILVVDDDPIFTAMAEACLTKSGYTVSVASDGVEALEILETQKFAAAMVDLSMPRIDGFRLIGLLRGDERHANLTIMVVSVRQDPAAFREAMLLGASAVETKPLDWSRLPGQVAALILDARDRKARVGA